MNLNGKLKSSPAGWWLRLKKTISSLHGGWRRSCGMADVTKDACLTACVLVVIRSSRLGAGAGTATCRRNLSPAHSVAARYQVAFCSAGRYGRSG
ncbi:hypothetical protein KCP76_24905 [Salmonella enterica subsp. enterica serovar Weltevreden]|nr:hypothetical protein KCP76_24905 [Salmonella enterica subsp. enterica serovar Weltevreden]